MIIRVKITRTENCSYFGCMAGEIVPVELEEYVAAVVASEIGNAPLEACKAQAIAARTYAMHFVVGNEMYITDRSSSHQAFRTSRWDINKYPNANAGAMETAGMVLTYGGRIITTCSYSASNGGRTVSSAERWGGERPYLIAQDDPWDRAGCAEVETAGRQVARGHGVGMSQIGAQWAARNGAGYREILGFYYPGTHITAGYGLTVETEDKMSNKEVGRSPTNAGHCLQWSSVASTALVAGMAETTERAMIPFTNEHFAAFLRSLLGRPYWYGTCLYKCTNSLYARKKKQYPTHYRSSRTDGYKKHIEQQEVCGDCIGAAKGYAWTNGGEGVVEAIGTDKSIQSKYGSHGCPDKGTSGMFAYAKEQGMPWGAIGTLPEIVGVAVTYSGHAGYYMGGGCVIEFKGFDYGCVASALSEGKWTHWYYLPFLDYGEAQDQDADEVCCTLGARLLKKNSRGKDVEQLQNILVGMGYDLGSYGTLKDGVDGKYGDKTVAAVKRFQSYAQIKVDGKYGSVTHKALMGLLDEEEKAEAPDESCPAAPTGMYVRAEGAFVDVRSGPDVSYKIITRVEGSDLLPYVATANAVNWHAVELGGKIGWIRGEESVLMVDGAPCERG